MREMWEGEERGGGGRVYLAVAVFGGVGGAGLRVKSSGGQRLQIQLVRTQMN
jgi:hypothetical protein